jgi:hypothetical protein
MFDHVDIYTSSAARHDGRRQMERVVESGQQGRRTTLTTKSQPGAEPSHDYLKLKTNSI